MSQDVTTFEELYERYANDVYRFAYWLCGDPHDAKDITSETFVRVWTSENETRLESVKGYLFTIARNLHLQQHRKKKRFLPITEENAGTTHSTERLTEDRSELEQTLTALDTLSEIDRTVLIMRAQDELPYDEIATATGLSISAVKVKIFRARAKLSLFRKNL
jgi:RNA polymerase sigma-70 factor (ECF subfamily)